jgi:D-alanyl-D-alanine carboxypeptidase/D-alanyl-D-alanine-endopeptidase (penicillin-binding protein 4)
MMKVMSTAFFFLLLSAPNSLQNRVESLLQQSPWHDGFWGVVVRDLSQGKTLVSLNPDQYLTPASSLKLLTAALAYETLGADFAFQTPFFSDRPIDARGAITSLTIIGAGDPSLEGWILDSGRNTEEYFDELAARLFSLGLRSIEKGLKADCSLFVGDPFPPTWEWDDTHYYFATPVRALSANLGWIPADVEADATGFPMISPLDDSFDLARFSLQSQWLDHDIIARRGQRENEFLLGVPLRSCFHKTFEVPAADPAALFLHFLYRALTRQGIDVGPQRLISDEPLSRHHYLLSHYSLSLSHLVRVILERSQNGYAETLALALTAHRNGSGDVRAYGRLAKGFLKELLPEPPVGHGPLIADGSGLSRHNFITARQLAQLLDWVSRQSYFELFHQQLPILGHSGTLKTRGHFAPSCLGRVHAKTGSLTRVSSLCGYFHHPSGSLLSFAILSNHSSARREQLHQAEERLLQLIAKTSL